jgi:hypothetical protein
MGGNNSKKEQLETCICLDISDFIKAHCILEVDATTDAILFMETFIAFFTNRNKRMFRDLDVTRNIYKYCTAAWMSTIIQKQCPELHFVGNCPRLYRNKILYDSSFHPTTIVGVKLINLKTLWSTK